MAGALASILLPGGGSLDLPDVSEVDVGLALGDLGRVDGGCPGQIRPYPFAARRIDSSVPCLLSQMVTVATPPSLVRAA